MNENSFYIAKYCNGQIDRKINLTQRDLTLAFVSGRFSNYKEDDIEIYKVDLDSITVEKISVSDILQRIEDNKIKRKEREERERQRAIKRRIEELKKLL